MTIKTMEIAGGAIRSVLWQQVGTANRAERAFTAAQSAQAAAVGTVLAQFIASARSSIHMAIYDFRLDGEAAQAVVGALNERARAGIDVRIAYFEAKDQPTPEAFTLLGSDPAVVNDGLVTGDVGLHGAIRTRGITENPGLPTMVAPPVEGEPITAPHNLMHSKYIVRDGLSADAAVLMGSANFTTDAWSVQDNNLLVFEKCQELSAAYETDFGEMWQSGQISNTGNFDTADVEVRGVGVQVMFAPGRGRQIGTEIAARIDAARDRLLVASMVISSGPILGAIADRMHRVAEFGGLIDGPEMHMVMTQWGRATGTGRRAGASAAKGSQFQELSRFLHVKPSLPYQDKGVHNFMHNKFAVVDDAVITGSFNFSTNAQSNAENVVIVEDKELADAYADYARALFAAYPEMGPP